MAGDPEVVERLVSRLEHAGVVFRRTRHAPVSTSAEAAAVRGVSLHTGAKALLLKCDDRFLLAVLPADLVLDSAALRGAVGTRRTRFASREELLEMTGLPPGAVPPFGSLFGVPTVCDPRLADNESINFNAGSNSESLQMSYRDWQQVEDPKIVPIAKLDQRSGQS